MKEMNKKISKWGIKIGNLLINIINFNMGVMFGAYLIYNSRVEEGYAVVSVSLIIFLFSVLNNAKMEKEAFEKKGITNV
ncbi:MAG: hypothetical protein WBF48_06440 [Halarcobacter sp.]